MKRHFRNHRNGECVERLAVTSVPVGGADERLDTMRERLASQPFELLDPVIVLGTDRRFLGIADLRDVMAGEGETTLSSVLKPNHPSVTPQTDPEHAAELAVEAGVAALPVVSTEGVVLGCIPPAILLSVLAREHREDMHRLAGILRERSNAVHALDDPPLWRVGQRLPWLVIGLLLSASAAWIMAAYEEALQTNVMIAFFIPSIVYLADAIGTQTETIAVRGLALRRKPLGQLLLKEAATGSLLGLVLGMLALLGVWIAFGDIKLAAGVSLSLFVAGALASTIGLMLPWMLSRLGIDPAFGSGPVGTIIHDVLTIFLYLLVMTALF